MHRGAHPEDRRLFESSQEPVLRQAVADVSWLLSRNYSAKAVLTLVGDHFQLQQRQRVAVGRCACSDAARERRLTRRVELPSVETVWIDGLNVLTTVEAALAGGVVLWARDGCFRDMAAFHGNYRVVEEALPAARLIGTVLAGRSARWLLDAPVSNTGRLAALLRGLAAEQGWNWEVELVPDPDGILRESPAVVATSDSGILDKAARSLNLARLVVERCVPQGWLLRLTSDPS